MNASLKINAVLYRVITAMLIVSSNALAKKNLEIQTPYSIRVLKTIALSLPLNMLAFGGLWFVSYEYFKLKPTYFLKYIVATTLIAGFVIARDSLNDEGWNPGYSVGIYLVFGVSIAVFRILQKKRILYAISISLGILAIGLALSRICGYLAQEILKQIGINVSW